MDFSKNLKVMLLQLISPAIITMLLMTSSHWSFVIAISYVNSIGLVPSQLKMLVDLFACAHNFVAIPKMDVHSHYSVGFAFSPARYHQFFEQSDLVAALGFLWFDFWKKNKGKNIVSEQKKKKKRERVQFD